MKTTVNQHERAKRAWDILVERAANRRPMTYGEMGSQMGVFHRTCRFFLHLIQEHCHSRGLPPLQSLVVNQATLKPGPGYIATHTDAMEEVHRKVFAFDWHSERNPFALPLKDPEVQGIDCHDPNERGNAGLCTDAPTMEADMDVRVTRLRTPQECEQFALNVAKRLPELAQAARRRAAQLKAQAHGAQTDAEREALTAVYAYERALYEKHGKTVRASRTWRMIERYGIIPAVERVVLRRDETLGYTALVEMGMQEFAFEAVVCRHPEVFSPEAVRHSRQRLHDWTSGKTDNTD